MGFLIPILEGKNSQITDMAGRYNAFLSWNENRPFLCGLCTDFAPIWLCKGFKKVAEKVAAL